MREPLLHEAPLLEGLGVSKRYRTAATRLFAREGGLWGLGNAEGETVDLASIQRQALRSAVLMGRLARTPR